MSLRKCSKDLRHHVDKTKNHYKTVEIAFNNTFVSLILKTDNDEKNIRYSRNRIVENNISSCNIKRLVSDILTIVARPTVTVKWLRFSSNISRTTFSYNRNEHSLQAERMGLEKIAFSLIFAEESGDEKFKLKG